ncbi:hypothetical protein TSTA_095360 [Talaromyces stipitatus ATCC 10500]|uniref:Uncharacterized protein n=1 Tax=Talaromyces stipitatus (strain ATCC 10500 / CBS 375.48 / QM 6759 / NRRL 1006) TaxID=441959 RepID=B8M3B5_TALSN|nr:uncharacterized protein TSTA_095360 [Talaromyces stipitatus ATCC 10500]EED22287.1 hypothetical protein TSTA_095360 [Talaromyces stipitatus ATCC 10500]
MINHQPIRLQFIKTPVLIIPQVTLRLQHHIIKVHPPTATPALHRTDISHQASHNTGQVLRVATTSQAISKVIPHKGINKAIRHRDISKGILHRVTMHKIPIGDTVRQTEFAQGFAKVLISFGNGSGESALFFSA